MSKSTTKKKRKLNPKLFDFALIGSAILYLLAEVYNKILPTQIGIIAIFVVVILMAIGLLVNNKIAKGFLISFILIASFGLYYIQAQIDKVMNIEIYESNTVSFVVLDKSKYDAIDDLGSDVSVGVSENFNNDLFEAMKADLQDEYELNGNVIKKQDDFSVAQALYNGEVEVMILDEVYRSTVNEQDPEFNDNTRVIYSYKKHDKKDDIAKPVDVKKEGFTIFISGIDTEGPVNTVARSDVNMLMSINPKTNEILLVTTPRDTYVPLSCKDGRNDKLTHAGVYGVDCSVKTLEDFYDIDINYYAKVNFTSFIKLIDVIGNIDVYSHYDFTSDHGVHFNQGINTLNSEEALVFARTRYTVPGGDVTRGLHQQEVIKGIINKLIEPATMLNIGSIVNKVSASVDTNFGGTNLSKLIEKQLGDGKGWAFETLSLDGTAGEDYTASYPYQKLYIMYPNKDTVNSIHDAITDITTRTVPKTTAE